MASITSNQYNMNTSLWNRARSRWLEDIHDQIGKVGKQRKTAVNKNVDGVTLSSGAVGCLSGKKYQEAKNPVIRKHLAKSFRGQVAPRNKEKFKAPVPQNNPKMHRKAYLSRNYPFGQKQVEPYFTDHTRDPLSLSPKKQYIKPDPNGGAFENPLLDGIIDTVGTVAEMISYGFKDAGRAILSLVG